MKTLATLLALTLVAGVATACPPQALLAPAAPACDCGNVQTVPESAPVLVPRAVTTYAVPQAAVVAADPVVYAAPAATFAVRRSFVRRAAFAPSYGVQRAFVQRAPAGCGVAAAAFRAPVSRGVVPAGGVNVNVFRKLKIKNSVVR